jgi:S-adenosylmethionine synthetase
MHVNIDLCMIMCVDAEYGYSKNNKMPWNIESEYEHFQKILHSYPQGKASIIIGRKTWESDGISIELRNQFANILVLSKSKVISYENILYVSSIAEAIDHIKNHLIQTGNFSLHRVFVLGGGEIYRHCIDHNLVDQLILSRLPKAYQCTAFLDWLPEQLAQRMQLTHCVQNSEFLVENYQKIKKISFTCESVTEGHPDKVCDIISDSIVDAYLSQDPWSKVACEVMAYENMVALCGYSQSDAIIDPESIVRNVLEHLGFDDEGKGLDYKTCSVSVNIHKTASPRLRDIRLLPADDQAVVYGYATNETDDSVMMPLPHHLATMLTLRLSDLRQKFAQHQLDDLNESEKLLASMLRPSGKAQITAEYEAIDKFSRHVRVTAVVLEAQHNPNIDLDELKKLLNKNVIAKVLPAEILAPNFQLFINGDGEYTHGGFRGGGLTGRKQNIDTYGGLCRMGGGAFSGKDYRKMDRSGAYAARWIAKSLVAAKLCDRCTVSLAYAIGYTKPLMITIDTEYTAALRGYTDTQLADIVHNNFDLTAGGIIHFLGLQAPIYKKTAAGGHFGRAGFSWEEPKKLVY